MTTASAINMNKHVSIPSYANNTTNVNIHNRTNNRQTDITGTLASKSIATATLDNRHNQECERLHQSYAVAERHEAELNELNEGITSYVARGLSNLSDKEFDAYTGLLDRQTVLRRDLGDILSMRREIDYMLDTADIVFQYYDVIERNTNVGEDGAEETEDDDGDGAEDDFDDAEGCDEDESKQRHSAACSVNCSANVMPKQRETSTSSSKGIMKYFMAQESSSPTTTAATRDAHSIEAFATETDSKDRSATITDSASASSLSQIGHQLKKARTKERATNRAKPDVSQMSFRDRASLLDMYLSKVDTNHLKKLSCDNTDRCPVCDAETGRVALPHEGLSFCTECSAVETLLVDHERPSYKEPPKEITYFAYKRINHLNEWLSQTQGKESTDIPADVYDRILLEIRKQRITNMAKVTAAKIKEILKRLGLNRYYEHSVHIMHRLNGLPSIQLKPETEDKLRQMFKMIQIPFFKHAPKTRKNFLSYSYTIHKCLQLLELDQYLPYFPLLKSREKTFQMDGVWKKICEELNWHFYPSC
jgi:hypothetical protein